jgi:hypothetical protein
MDLALGNLVPDERKDRALFVWLQDIHLLGPPQCFVEGLMMSCCLGSPKDRAALPRSYTAATRQGGGFSSGHEWRNLGGHRGTQALPKNIDHPTEKMVVLHTRCGEA